MVWKQFLVCVLFSVNHVYLQIKYRVCKHSGKTDDVHIYTDHVIQLLKSEHEEAFEWKYHELSLLWNKQFCNYFETQKEEIMAFAARYNIKIWKKYNPHSGITNNAAKSLNVVIKCLLYWKEVPTDCQCLSLHYFSIIYFVEIERGRIGVGDFKPGKNVSKAYFKIR